MQSRSRVTRTTFRHISKQLNNRLVLYNVLVADASGGHGALYHAGVDDVYAGLAQNRLMGWSRLHGWGTHHVREVF